MNYLHNNGDSYLVKHLNTAFLCVYELYWYINDSLNPSTATPIKRLVLKYCAIVVIEQKCYEIAVKLLIRIAIA